MNCHYILIQYQENIKIQMFWKNKEMLKMLLKKEDKMN